MKVVLLLLNNKRAKLIKLQIMAKVLCSFLFDCAIILILRCNSKLLFCGFI